MRRPIRLKYLSQSGKWPSGNPRWYYRAPGQKAQAMPDAPSNSPTFLKAYAEVAGEIEKGPRIATRGSIARAIGDFRCSPDYAQRATSTQAVWARMLVDIAEMYGTGKIADLRTVHIRKDLARLDPHPANNRLKVWRALCKWALQSGLIETNPARDVEKRSVPKSDGHIPWTRDDVASFREYWPYDSLQRFAFELIHWTTAAIGDAARLQRSQIDGDGWLTYHRQKTGTLATCPIYADAPPWAESNADFLRAMEAQPSKHMSLIVTRYGKPRSAKAAGSWFSAACTDAGLPHLSSHGIRKHRSAVFKENGAEADKRMAWMGHETVEEATNYSKSADLKRTIAGAVESANSASVVKISTKRQT